MITCVVRYTIAPKKIAAFERFGRDPEFIAADHIRDESGCVLRYERTFTRPLLPGAPAPGDGAPKGASPADTSPGPTTEAP
ncbi:hypothetical protein [Streptomyces californicus]|uniref:hypothetical protein n=1 Tax=Streptomyces californicus TaxID=67351 RepID=UPI0037A290CD